MNTPLDRLFRRLSRLGFGSLLAVASFAAFGQVNVLTQHNDISRTGANTLETTLTTANVNQTQFGKKFTLSVDGQVYAQPLYVSALNVNGGTHNVVYVCTEHNSVYAFDANTGGSPLWHVNLGASDTNQGCTDITVEYGITSTPVIDMSTNTIYIDSKSTVGGNHVQTLHALDLGTGAEKFGAPVNITATVGGVTFSANLQHQRPGLLLLNGVVYLAFASHCDNGAYHGWLLGYRAGPSTISQVTAFCTTRTGTLGGIWGCGMGPVADANGFIYVETGNGSFDGTANFAQSFLKLNTAGGLSVADYFTPHQEATWSSADLDVGSAGPVLVGGHYLIGLSKPGMMYLCDTNNMGKFNANTDNCLQAFSAAASTTTVGTCPVYWAGPSKQYLFIATGNDSAKSYQFLGTSINTTALGHASFVSGRVGGSSLSSNGTSNGIFWTIATNNVLYAYDAVNFPNILWASNQNATRDGLGTYVKMTPPTIANGMVYAATSNSVVAYGLLVSGPPQVAAPVFSPGGGTYTGAQNVTISDSTSGASIRYTLDGSTPSETAGTLYTGPVNIASTATLKAIGYLSGDTDSTITSATYTITPPPPPAAPSFSPAPGTYSSAQSVTISDTTSGASIFYTTDGSTPTTASTLYTSPVSIAATTTLKAIANNSNGSSSVTSGTYTISTLPPAAPSFSPAPGSYTGTQSVAISDTTTGASIFYTTDGSTPTTSSISYTGPVSIAATTTLQAIANDSNGSSSVTSGTYTITPQTGISINAGGPAVSPFLADEDFTGGATINHANTINTSKVTNPAPAAVYQTARVAATAGAGTNFSYTIGGFAAGSNETVRLHFCETFWTAAGSRVFNVSINGTQVLTNFDIFATAGGQNIADIQQFTAAANASGQYVIVFTSVTDKALISGIEIGSTTTPPPPAAPSFSPAPGTYSSTQSVTISDTTTGASIFYTTDGSTPTTASTAYTGPVSIAATTTLKAIANNSNGSSSVTSGTYTITTSSGPITLQASNLAPTGSGAAISTTADAAAPGGTWVKIASTAVGQWIQFTTPSIPAGTYSLSFIYRTNPTRAQHNVTIDGTQVGTTIVDQYAAGNATYPPAVAIGSVTFGTAGTHTIRLTATGKNAASTDFQISAVQFIFQ